jgi:hypothetical protein
MASPSSPAPQSVPADIYACADCQRGDCPGEPTVSLIGKRLCPGCAERRDTATMSLLAMTVSTSACASGDWLGRHLRRTH